MATTVIQERQWVLSATAVYGLANIGTGNGLVVTLPPKSYLKELDATVVTAPNGGTTNTFTAVAVTLGPNPVTTTPIASYTPIVGQATVVTVPTYFPNGATITFSGTQTGTAATAAQILIDVEYTVAGRSNEIATN